MNTASKSAGIYVRVYLETKSTVEKVCSEIKLVINFYGGKIKLLTLYAIGV